MPFIRMSQDPDQPNHYLNRKYDLLKRIAYHTNCIDHPEEEQWVQEALGDGGAETAESMIEHHYIERAKLRGYVHRINQELGA